MLGIYLLAVRNNKYLYNLDREARQLEANGSTKRMRNFPVMGSDLEIRLEYT